MQETFKQTIAEVVAANDIVDVIGAYLELKPSGGGRFKAICPFHKEKTPSFSVNRDRQNYYCFGCEKHGDAITFLREYDGLSFREALERLAERAGIQIDKVAMGTGGSSKKRDSLFELGKFAAKFYTKNLNDPLKGKGGSDYLKGRDMKSEMISHFGLGLARDEWSDLRDGARAKSFEDNTILESGLVKRGERGTLYDFFRNRVIFPIRDSQGRFVAFGGRALGDDAAKYINSPESPVYKKGRVLYGLYEARESMRREKRALLVEGYFDVIRCFEAGIEFAVAPCGTALTREQATLLRRYVQEVTVVFDGDAAGVRAALRGIAVLTAEGLHVRALALPEGQDPDDYIRAHGAQAFAELLDAAPDFVRYYVRMSESRTETIEGRTEVARELFAILHDMDNELRRDEYLKLLAKELGLNPMRCRDEYARYVQDQSNRPKPAVSTPNKETPKVHHSDRDFLTALIHEKDLRPLARKELAGVELPEGPVADIFHALMEHEKIQDISQIPSEEGQRLYAELSNQEISWAESMQALVMQRVAGFRKDALQRQAGQVKEEIDDAVRLKDDTRVAELVRKQQELWVAIHRVSDSVEGASSAPVAPV